ncbi:thiamine pyrophosphate-dependent dehydrogenase E1 component subunit alpha [Streptomyces sp. ALI-76-A]|jgi:pyruvate dehydrogenase E1 component alpha subunit|uniref:thiamine pyrophosphate-dependent dehydrogenase E1 component subunit alpha n=1 Tax=Streptomyces sp. ALI-76-A TaxID=3025736 RepID=UPI00256EE7AE|nr:thiamine pyrophosphate-dependent dehydrogenase E1 component subunit alpha [Streptomyces sp. ALI-76-A]MDL5205743.1 thiamine pyrophosphate-dependent dehydrogenase E1 component subunit alpha [Streptomyces sp. ALI-76-A]
MAQRASKKSADPAANQTSAQVIRDLHERMVRIRLFETEAGKLMEAGKLPGFLHLYVGQEAVAAGVMAALRDDDQITSTHRGHGHAVAKGVSFNHMYSELYGRVTGACLGRGGSMHINDVTLGMLGANGIVGAGIPIAVGAAFAAQYRGEDNIAVTFFGDGATNIGSFHEAANMAAILRLSVLFVCENNGYAEFTPQSKHMLITDVADRAASYGMPSVIVDGMDALAVHQATVEAVAHARAGEGPMFIEAKTYRYYDHQGVKGLRHPYRSDAEVEEWKARDAIDLLEARALADGTATRAELDDTWQRTRDEIAEAIAYAEASPLPDTADLLLNVYSG